MADLASAHFPQFNPGQALTGGLDNATQANIPAQTNATWFGFTAIDSAAGGVTAVANAVAVPVDWGVVITNATVLCGAAAGTITHANVQLFSGIATPAALGTQSTDATSTPFTVNTFATFTLGSAVLTSPTNAPNHYLYFSLGLTNSVAPSLASASTPVAIVSGGASGFGASAPVLAAKYTGGGAAQPTTLASATTVAAAILVWLT
jgi:hypothetical protein